MIKYVLSYFHIVYTNYIQLESVKSFPNNCLNNLPYNRSDHHLEGMVVKYQPNDKHQSRLPSCLEQKI